MDDAFWGRWGEFSVFVVAPTTVFRAVDKRRWIK